MRSRLFLFVISIVFLSGSIFFLHSWLFATIEFTPISITSSGKTLYFFAHQAVTQKIFMEEAARIVRIEVPWYPPTITTPVVVEMHRYGKLVSRWHINSVGDGSLKFLSLVLPTPQYVDGILEISFIAPEVDHAHLENAPKILIEPLDESFPSGNYRIGDEEKHGDIQMRLIAQKERVEVLQEIVTNEPFNVLGEVFRYTAGLFLLLALPFFFSRNVKR